MKQMSPRLLGGRDYSYYSKAAVRVKGSCG